MNLSAAGNLKYNLNFVSIMKRIPIDRLSEQVGLKIEIMRFEMKDIPYAYDEANIARENYHLLEKVYDRNIAGIDLLDNSRRLNNKILEF